MVFADASIVRDEPTNFLPAIVGENTHEVLNHSRIKKPAAFLTWWGERAIVSVADKSPTSTAPASRTPGSDFLEKFKSPPPWITTSVGYGILLDFNRSPRSLAAVLTTAVIWRSLPPRSLNQCETKISGAPYSAEKTANMGFNNEARNRLHLSLTSFAIFIGDLEFERGESPDRTSGEILQTSLSFKLD